MNNPILSVSIPQMEDDLDIIDDLAAILKVRGFIILDTSIEYETNNIRYRFQRVEDDR